MMFSRFMSMPDRLSADGQTLHGCRVIVIDWVLVFDQTAHGRHAIIILFEFYFWSSYFCLFFFSHHFFLCGLPYCIWQSRDSVFAGAMVQTTLFCREEGLVSMATNTDLKGYSANGGKKHMLMSWLSEFVPKPNEMDGESGDMHRRLKGNHFQGRYGSRSLQIFTVNEGCPNNHEKLFFLSFVFLVLWNEIIIPLVGLEFVFSPSIFKGIDLSPKLSLASPLTKRITLKPITYNKNSLSNDTRIITFITIYFKIRYLNKVMLFL